MIKQCIKIALIYHMLQMLCAAGLAPSLPELSLYSSISGLHGLIMPPTWIGRNDVFNPEEDLKALLYKTKVSGTLLVKNNTVAPVSIRAFGKIQTITELESVEVDLIINPGETITTLHLLSYDNLKLSPESHGFIDFYAIQDRFEVSIELQPILLFPRRLDSFSFTPDRTLITSGSNTRQAEITKYQGQLNFLERYVCKYEDIKITDLFQHRENLYNTYCLEEIIKLPLPPISRIPLNLFSIWLTNLDTPTMPDTKFLEMAKASAKNNPQSDGWNYYFLVQDVLLPEMTAALEGTGILVINFSDLLGPLELQTEFNEALMENNFGKASDILRVEALRKKGGGYLDIDLQVFHSLKSYFYCYDSVFGIEPMSEWIGNAFMACAANHPIIIELTNLIRRNCELENEKTKDQSGKTKKEIEKIRKFYANLFTNQKNNTIFTTGPCATSVAFHKAAGKGTIDIALAPEALYPGKTLRRPEYDLPTTDDPIRLGTASIHLWKNTWLS